MQAAVFLDRDGVLNEMIIQNGERTSPKTFDQFRLFPYVREAVNRLRGTYAVIVVSNQPDISRGRLSWTDLHRMNIALKERVALHDVLVCVHDDRDACPCRKPKPGLIFEAAKKWSLDLSRSFLVGDSWKDMEAGRRAGVGTGFIVNGIRDPRVGECTFEVRDLTEAVETILSRGGPPCF